MRFIYLLAALWAGYCPVWAQTMANYQKALSVLQKSISATGKDIPASLLLTTSGTIHNLGHYDIPEKTKNIPVDEKVAYFAPEQVYFVRTAIQINGSSYVSSSVSKSDSLYSIDYFDRTLIKSNAHDFRYDAAKVLPIKLLQFAYANRQSLRYLGEQNGHNLLSFSYKPNDAVTIYINSKTSLLSKVEKIGYNDRYGDVPFTSEYSGYKDKNGLKTPTSRIDYEFGLPEREVTYTDIRSNVKPDTSDLQLRWVPVAFRTKLPEINQKNETLVVETIAPNIDLIKITSQNNKVLVVQFSEHVAL
ncbi:hypothetical protein LC612_42675, partial [Nostoc sp. CHAB 5834]|nr:hypothetical protein [Nostoc sp. CHAB 5834]